MQAAHGEPQDQAALRLWLVRDRAQQAVEEVRLCKLWVCKATLFSAWASHVTRTQKLAKDLEITRLRWMLMSRVDTRWQMKKDQLVNVAVRELAWTRAEAETSSADA